MPGIIRIEWGGFAVPASVIMLRCGHPALVVSNSQRFSSKRNFTAKLHWRWLVLLSGGMRRRALAVAAEMVVVEILLDVASIVN